MVAGNGRHRVLCGNRGDTAKGFVPICLQRAVYEVAAEDEKVGCRVMRVMLHNIGYDIICNAVDGVLYVAEVYELCSGVGCGVMQGEVQPLRRVGFHTDAVVVDAGLRGVEVGAVECRCTALRVVDVGLCRYGRSIAAVAQGVEQGGFASESVALPCDAAEVVAFGTES